MSFLSIAQKRYSCRSYQSKALSDELLLQVMEAARVAPSAKNLQPWKFIVVRKTEQLEKIYQCYKRDWIRTAPAIIIAIGDHANAWWRTDGKDFTSIDLSIAIDHITLAATDLGMATCWVCNFNAMLCSELFDLPAGLEPIALIPIGFQNESNNSSRHADKRKLAHEIVYWENLEYGI